MPINFRLITRLHVSLNVKHPIDRSCSACCSLSYVYSTSKQTKKILQSVDWWKSYLAVVLFEIRILSTWPDSKSCPENSCQLISLPCLPFVAWDAALDTRKANPAANMICPGVTSIPPPPPPSPLPPPPPPELPVFFFAVLEAVWPNRTKFIVLHKLWVTMRSHIKEWSYHRTCSFPSTPAAACWRIVLSETFRSGEEIREPLSGTVVESRLRAFIYYWRVSLHKLTATNHWYRRSSLLPRWNHSRWSCSLKYDFAITLWLNRPCWEMC